ncbi:MAG: hypothetical protein RL095_235 [Verrucomicrobiota bacterium]
MMPNAKTGWMLSSLASLCLSVMAPAQDAAQGQVPHKIEVGQVYVGDAKAIPFKIENKSRKELSYTVTSTHPGCAFLPSILSLKPGEMGEVYAVLRAPGKFEVPVIVTSERGQERHLIQGEAKRLYEVDGVVLNQLGPQQWVGECAFADSAAVSVFSKVKNLVSYKTEKGFRLEFKGQDCPKEGDILLINKNSKLPKISLPIVAKPFFEVRARQKIVPGYVQFQIARGTGENILLDKITVAGHDLTISKPNEKFYEVTLIVTEEDVARGFLNIEILSQYKGMESHRVQIDIPNPKKAVAVVSAVKLQPLAWDLTREVQMKELGSDEDGHGVFTLSNKDKRVIEFTLLVSCKCMGLEVQKVSLKPGESRQLPFVVHGMHLADGPYHRGLFVRDDQGNLQVIAVKGNVRSQVVPVLQELNLGEIAEPGLVSCKFKVPISGLLSHVRSELPGCRVSEHPVGVRAGDEGELQLYIHPNQVGNITGFVVFEMNGKAVGKLALSYHSSKSHGLMSVGFPPRAKRQLDPTLYVSAADAVKASGVTLIDLRDFAAQQEVQIPGALTMKFSALEAATQLKTGKLILFGSGLLTYELEVGCKSLAAKGFTDVKILRGGLLAWIAAGGKLTGNAEAAGNCQALDLVWARDYDSTVLVNATGASLPLTLLARSVSPEEATLGSGSDFVVIGKLRQDSKLPGPVWRLQGGLSSLIKAAQDLPQGKALEPRNSACGGCL